MTQISLTIVYLLVGFTVINVAYRLCDKSEGVASPEVVDKFHSDVANEVSSYYAFDRESLLKVISAVWFISAKNRFKKEIIIEV